MSRPGAGTPQGSGEFPGGKGWNGARIDWLRARLGSVTRPLSYADLGRLVQARLKRKPPHAASKFHRWVAGEGEPDAETQAVLADLAEMSFERWCLGRDRGQSAPVDGIVTPNARKLTDAEIARARDAVAEKATKRRRG